MSPGLHDPRDRRPRTVPALSVQCGRHFERGHRDRNGRSCLPPPAAVAEEFRSFDPVFRQTFEAENLLAFSRIPARTKESQKFVRRLQWSRCISILPEENRCFFQGAGADDDFRPIFQTLRGILSADDAFGRRIEKCASADFPRTLSDRSDRSDNRGILPLPMIFAMRSSSGCANGFDPGKSLRKQFPDSLSGYCPAEKN